MARYARLTALDRMFLDIEDRTSHMHVGSTCVFDVGPLRTPTGGVDAERVRRYIDSRLHLMPGHRRRLATIPFENHPVWVDDDAFNIRYHVRHMSVPKPGGERQLKRLVGWINSQQLDRGKPLWEIWLIEGLEEDRFALVTKTHHSMIDGLSGADLLAVLLSASDDAEIEEAHRWLPEPEPSPGTLLRDAALRRAKAPFVLASAAANEIVRHPRRALRQTTDALGSLGEALGQGLTLTTATPFNREISAHRRFDWLPTDLGTIKAIKNKLGGTVNDIVITTVAGALGHFLARRGIPPLEQRDNLYRAFCPVSLRTARQRGTMGNKVSSMMAELPVTESDPVRRLVRVREIMDGLKNSRQARGTELVETIADWTSPLLLSSVSRLVNRNTPYNLVVTNVPGPQIPLYLLGARLRAIYPLVPLFSNQGLGIALFSYAGGLNWGFNADRELMPDLHEFVEAVAGSLRQLQAAAGVANPIEVRPESVGKGEDGVRRRRTGAQQQLGS
jgi:diacylglycerol O-acyltransferase